MDYEKKYKEALELARVAAFNGHQSLMEGIFPELKESEDEKTRKRIIALVNAHGQGMYKDDMLAWLENIPYTIDHEKREGFHLGYKAGLEKQGEQNPTDKDMVEALRTEYEKGRADAFAQMQKEWSEEDEKMVANLVDYFKVDDALQYTEKQVVDWLKSLKGRAQPQPKQEWSKEDQNALEDVREAVVHYWGGDTQDILLYWLKSIKQKLKGE